VLKEEGLMTLLVYDMKKLTITGIRHKGGSVGCRGAGKDGKEAEESYHQE